MRKCQRCQKSKEDEYFYTTHHYCRDCVSDLTLERQRDMKQKCFEYKGAKCEKCGFIGEQYLFDFHHLDPKQKEFSLSKIKATNFEKNKAKIVKELDKTQLLCANCHRETHDEIYEESIKHLRILATGFEPV